MLQQAISMLEQELTNTQEGLPYELFLFVSRLTPLVSVDLLIQDDDGRTLFTWRDDEFFGKGWHLPGGVIRHNEKMEERIEKVGELELGAKLRFEQAPLTFVQDIDVTKKNRGHFLAFLYRSRLESEPDHALRYHGEEDPKPGQWAWFTGAPEPLLKVHEVYREYF